ncbi:MAG: ribonuclease J [Clostridia bacterium]|nr:ribonuclease J [Clostridia bacterium]
MPIGKLRIIPLGGVDEIGKNITVFEYGDDILVVDCGLIFPKEDMLGIDLVIPDVSYLVENKERVRGYLITHGHEDHIGALPYVLRQVNAPVYGTKLTLALVQTKLQEHGIDDVHLQVVQAKDTLRFDSFTVQFIKVSHSIAGAVAMAITSPVGTVIVTGDFKVDYTPIDGEVTDLNAFAAWGTSGVLALLAESTNVERPGYTMSEQKIAETFHGLFRTASGRIIIAMFASNIHRIQQVVDAATRFGRRVCFIGRSMVSVVRVAIQIGELKIPEGYLISADTLDRYDDAELVVLTTGSQGEPMSGLTRMAYSEHRKLQIRHSDLVILSAYPIPGNEVMVARVLNQLYRIGAQVVYDAIADVHVSGHACQEELKLIHTLTKPKFFMPVHGEYRMLWQHAQLAQAMGMDPKRVVIPEIGQVIELGEDSLHIAGSVPTGSVMVDGLGIGDVGNVVLRDRKHLSQDGLIIVVLAVDGCTGALISGPSIQSRGFVYARENEALIEGIRSLVLGLLRSVQFQQREWAALRNLIKDELHTYLYKQMRRNPMILPIVLELDVGDRD